jgi:spermidine synthase
VTRRPATSLIAVGFLSMVGQVALLRELAVASFGVELIFLVGTAFWLAAGAAGALAGGRRARGDGALAAGLCALALLLLAETAFLRGSRSLLGGVPGAFLPLGRQLATAALGVMPAAALLGWLFRRAAEELALSGGSLGAAYGWESLGGAAGSVAATSALAAGTPNLALLLAGAAAGALVAARHPPARRGAVALAAALVALLPLSPALDRATTRWSHPSLATVADTPYGRVAVTEALGQLVLFENDAISWESEATSAEPLVHPAALQVAEGARVLVLGGVATGIVREVLKHRPSRVVAVELNGALLRLLRPGLPAAERAALEAPAVEVRIEDPRAFLRGDAGPFDLILIGAPEPSSGQSNRLYTVEAFRRCAARLAPGGVLALRLPSSENFWTPGQLLRNGAVHAALRAAFRDVLVLPGSTDLMLASASTLVRDPDRLGERLRVRGITAREVSAPWLRYLLTNDRATAIDRVLAAVGAPVNGDARPVCYQQTALLWLGRMSGGAKEAHLPGRTAALGILGLLAAATAASRVGRTSRRAARVAAASLVGMLLEAVVLLRYQAEAGALYRDLGLLLTAFMAGLALGAAAWDRARTRAGGARGWWSAIPGAGLALLAAAMAATSHAGAGTGLAGSMAFLAADGALVAAAFASAARPEEGGRDAGALYAADLLGGCAGSLLAAGLFVLVLGLDGTALAAAVLAAVSVLLVP